MNKRPVSYLQTDPRWKNKPYRAPGESATIGGSGCGPTAAAMLISTLTGKAVTPVDTCKWAVDHGYKALNQGTYYSYFAPQFEAYGIKCWQLSWTNAYHKPNANVHKQALEYLKQGYYLIALMKKGNWTSGGHFVVVWWADNKIRINDPASTKEHRVNGNPATFRNEAAYYWVVDARAYNNRTEAYKPEGEEEDMDQTKFNEFFCEMRKELQDNDCGEWSKAARMWAVENGIIAGGGPGPDGKPNYMWADLLNREQAVMLLYRFAQFMGKA